MTTLADTFLDDLDELDESDEEEQPEEVKIKKEEKKKDQLMNDLDDLEDSDDDDGDDDNAEAGFEDMLGDEDKGVASVAVLRASAKFRKHMVKVREGLELPRTDCILGSLEDDPEYKLIVESNEFVVQVDEELLNVYRYVVDLYAKKFPELESLVPNPMDYVRVVMRIGNEMDMTMIDLSDLLPSAAVMVVSVTGSTTSGQKLPEEDLKNCLGGCEEATGLELDRIDVSGCISFTHTVIRYICIDSRIASSPRQVLTFVESRMNVFAPNVSAIVGSTLAAQLMGLAGGIINMSKMPSCNLQLLGQEKNKQLAGFGGGAALKHTGIIYGCDLVQGCPPQMRQKALRVVAAKVTLASRCDSYAGADESNRGGTGQRLFRELSEKIEKWQEPDKQVQHKALKKPDAMPKRKRGGRRVRKFKERFSMTDVRSQVSV
jgi:U4/U6 small nuclear ribonucleoprotein PRP31